MTTNRAAQINQRIIYTDQIYYIVISNLYERIQKNLATKTTKLSKMTILRNCKMECLNRISLRQCFSSYIYISTEALEVVTVHHCGASGKQSSQAMHELHEETGIGPGNTGPLVGRHRPIAAI